MSDLNEFQKLYFKADIICCNQFITLREIAVWTESLTF